MQRIPYVAGLSSLSVDGGIITLMDVVIDKIFPLAYTSAEKGNKDAPWDEEEERRRQDEWTVRFLPLHMSVKLIMQEKYTSESTKLKDELQKRMEKLEDLVEALCFAAEGVEGGRESWLSLKDANVKETVIPPMISKRYLTPSWSPSLSIPN